MTEKREMTSTGVIWAITFVLVVLILGGALYIREKRQPVPQVPPVTQTKVGVKVKTEADPSKSVKANLPIPDKSIPGKLSLSVPALWAGNNRLPLDHSCYRSNTSPKVTWGDIPKGTESLVLFMDKVNDSGLYSYWVLFNIPATVTGLPAALPPGPELENGARYGRNDHGVIQYTGPCDPKGTINYMFRLYALDTKLDIEAGAARSAIDASMKGHILDRAELPFVHYKRL